MNGRHNMNDMLDKCNCIHGVIRKLLFYLI